MSEELSGWAARLAREYRETPRRIEREIDLEAERLAKGMAHHAPRRKGALARSFSAEGPDVRTTVPYARVNSQGGTIRARRHGFLTIPVRGGFLPGPGFVTIGRPGNQVVVRSGTLEVWAARRREVLIRGSHFLERALEEHLEQAPKRVASVLPDVGGAA